MRAISWSDRFRTNLAKNLLSVAGATILARIIGIVALGYPARVLGPEKFGVVSFAASAIAYASIILSPGLLTWGTRKVAKNRSETSRWLTDVNSLQLMLATLAYCGLLAYAFIGVGDFVTRQYLVVAGLTLFTIGLSVDWVFNGLELNRVPASLSVISSALYVVGLFALLRSPDDLMRFAWLPILIGLPLIAFGYWLLKKRGFFLLRPDASGIRAAFVGALPLGITSALIIILHYANNFIVNVFLGTAALGLFAAAFRLVELVNTAPVMLATVFSPRLSRLSEESPEQAKGEASAFMGIHAVLAALVAAFFFSEGQAIGHLIYGAKFTGVGDLIQLFSIAVAANFAVSGYAACLVSYGLDRVMIRIAAISTIVSIGAGLLLVSQYGLWGAAVTIGLIDIAGVAVALKPFREHFGTLFASRWLHAALIAVALVVVAYGLKTMIPSFLLRLPIECFLAIVAIILEVRRYVK